MIITTTHISKRSIISLSTTFIDTVRIIDPTIAFHINIPNKTSFIIILNIDANNNTIRQNKYRYIVFKPMAIPRGITALSSTICTIDKILTLYVNFIITTTYRYLVSNYINLLSIYN